MSPGCNSGEAAAQKQHGPGLWNGSRRRSRLEDRRAATKGTGHGVDRQRVCTRTELRDQTAVVSGIGERAADVAATLTVRGWCRRGTYRHQVVKQLERIA